MNLILERKIKALRNLPEVRQALRVHADIAAERLAQENIRHAEAVQLIEEQLDVEAWGTVTAEWSPAEIQEAAQ